MATVVLTPEAVRDLHALPSPIAARVQRLIARLRQWPMVSGAKSLKGGLAGHYRLRTGDYRLQFRVDHARRVSKVKRVVKGKTVVEEKEVVEVKVIIEKAGHRDGFYDE
jgi:mRNA-degrading endonuclease RelE of RelBE toxin-antitoxin system